MPHDDPHNDTPTSTATYETAIAHDSPPGPPSQDLAPGRGWPAAVWNAITAAVGAVMGLLPHLLHHISFLAGAALITGVGGNLLFGALGLLLSVPMLRRLHRRFQTWKAPAVALAVFAAMFALSAFVIGPAISDTDPQPEPDPIEQIEPEHDEHHG